MIPKLFQNDPELIPKWSITDPNLIPDWKRKWKDVEHANEQNENKQKTKKKKNVKQYIIFFKKKNAPE